MPAHVPIFLTVIVVFALGGVFLAGATFLGPKRRSPLKDLPFDCGNPPMGNPHTRFSIKFYVVAILFLLFDVEAIYLFAWAPLARTLGVFGFIEMTLFIAILVLGLAYVWRKGALEWG